METDDSNINLPLTFNQVVDLVKRLPSKDKLKLTEILKKEVEQMPENDKVLTHYASEKVLSKDWPLGEEDEAWKDL